MKQVFLKVETELFSVLMSEAWSCITGGKKKKKSACIQKPVQRRKGSCPFLLSTSELLNISKGGFNSLKINSAKLIAKVSFCEMGWHISDWIRNKPVSYGKGRRKAQTNALKECNI